MQSTIFVLKSDEDLFVFCGAGDTSESIATQLPPLQFVWSSRKTPLKDSTFRVSLKPTSTHCEILITEYLQDKRNLYLSDSSVFWLWQLCRYLYYLGRIRTIQLEYTDAKDCLLQAARKAPASARGFRIQCTKWAAIVRLLLGEIPERTTFMQPGMRKALRPYFELTNVWISTLPCYLKLVIICLCLLIVLLYGVMVNNLQWKA